MSPTSALQHLDAMTSLLALVQERVELWRRELAALEQTSGTLVTLPDRPARCSGIPEDRCALRNADAAVDVGGMGGGPIVLACRGCGEVLSASSATEH